MMFRRRAAAGRPLLLIGKVGNSGDLYGPPVSLFVVL
jgi:hypothetical protein